MSTNFPARRRQFLQLSGALGVAGYCSGASPAYADTYPSRTITFIIPDGIGGGASTYVREFAPLLANYFHPHVNVEPLNDQGANGQKAAFDLYHAAPDGYMIGMLGDVLSVSQKGNNLSNLTWIATLGRSLFGIAVGHDSKISSVQDLQKLSRERPIVFASSGKTALSYFAIKVFCQVNNIRAKIVTGYKGSTGSMMSVARGDVDAIAQSLPTLKVMQDARLIRIMFVYSGKSPIPGIQDATSIKQPDLGEIVQWRFVAGPPSLPKPIVDKLSHALIAISNEPATINWSKKTGVPLYPLGPRETKQAVEAQFAVAAKWEGRL